MSQANRRQLLSTAVLAGLLLSRVAVADSTPDEMPKRAAPSHAVPRSANDPELKLPAPPEGVADLRLAEIYKRPFGERGLEFTEKALSLKGKRIRIPGYMVKRCSDAPGQFLFTALPIVLHDHEMGPCDDLPAETVYVTVPAPTPGEALKGVVPHTPGMLLLTGTLRLGARNEPDGRISWIRLDLDPPPPRPEEGATPKSDGKPASPLGEAASGAAPGAADASEDAPRPVPAEAPSTKAATDDHVSPQTPDGGVR